MCFGRLEMQKWNIPTDRAQGVDEKNGVVSLVVMFAPRVMVIEMSKMAHFLHFLLMPAKKSNTIWRSYLRASERSYLALSENAMDCCILSYHKQDSSPWRYRVLLFFLLTQQFFDISTLKISGTVTLKPINLAIFCKNLKRSFRCT